MQSFLTKPKTWQDFHVTSCSGCRRHGVSAPLLLNFNGFYWVCSLYCWRLSIDSNSFIILLYRSTASSFVTTARSQAIVHASLFLHSIFPLGLYATN